MRSSSSKTSTPIEASSVLNSSTNCSRLFPPAASVPASAEGTWAYQFSLACLASWATSRLVSWFRGFSGWDTRPAATKSCRRASTQLSRWFVVKGPWSAQAAPTAAKAIAAQIAPLNFDFPFNFSTFSLSTFQSSELEQEVGISLVRLVAVEDHGIILVVQMLITKFKLSAAPRQVIGQSQTVGIGAPVDRRIGVVRRPELQPVIGQQVQVLGQLVKTCDVVDRLIEQVGDIGQRGPGPVRVGHVDQ